jgi:hypothetical protein
VNAERCGGERRRFVERLAAFSPQTACYTDSDSAADHTTHPATRHPIRSSTRRQRDRPSAPSARSTYGVRPNRPRLLASSAEAPDARCRRSASTSAPASRRVPGAPGSSQRPSSRQRRPAAPAALLHSHAELLRSSRPQSALVRAEAPPVARPEPAALTSEVARASLRDLQLGRPSPARNP